MSSDCDRCGEHCLDCKCNELRLKDYFCCNGHQFNEDEIKTGRLCPFCEKEKKERIECHKTGCRSLETRCKDCGEVVNTTILGLNDENKQSSPKNITEIPTKEGNSGWIDREVEFPDCDKILCCEGKEIFICQLVESKWGNHYRSTDWGHNESDDPREWTHWMPLPEPPKE